MLVVDSSAIVNEVLIEHEVVLCLLLYQIELIESRELLMRNEILLLAILIS